MDLLWPLIRGALAAAVTLLLARVFDKVARGRNSERWTASDSFSLAIGVVLVGGGVLLVFDDQPIVGALAVIASIAYGAWALYTGAFRVRARG